MKSNHRTNNNQNTLKQAAITLWFACIGLFCLVLLLPSISFADDEEVPGFCWDQNNSGTCVVQKDNDFNVRRPEHLVGTVDKDEEIIVPGEPFKFRVACHSTSKKCDDGKPDWEIALESISHTIDGVPASGSDRVTFQLDAYFNLNDGKSVKRENWQTDTNQVGGSQDYLFENGMSGTVDLTLRIPKGQAAKLKPGTHRFIYEFKGEGNYNDKVYRHLFYTFTFNIGDIKQVQITGLENIPLGTFPDHEDYSHENFCVYATGSNNGQGGSFYISGSSANAGQGRFYLKNNSGESSVYYLAKVGAGVDTPEDSLTTLNAQDAVFTGSPVVDCGGGENMTLGIKLNATFEQLSQLPAGTYSDVLTLTVEAL